MSPKLLFATFSALFFACFMPKLYAQIADKTIKPYTFLHPNSIPKNVDTHNLPPVNVAELLAQDAQVTDKTQAYRFGYTFNVNLNASNSGTWTVLANGDRIWKLAVTSKNALSLNFTFSQLYLPPQATLHLYNSEHTNVLGAFTSQNANTPTQRFATTLVKGSTVFLEYYEPKSVENKGIIQISHITHAYRGVASLNKDFGEAGDCNININCPEAADWQTQKRAVAMIMHNGFRFCSGAMLNNVKNDGTPYFLTANHCLDADYPEWVFVFNYESPNCTNTDNNTDQAVTGCKIMASNGFSDFALLELLLPPPTEYGVYYAGWNNTKTPSPNTTSIHHPQGDIKKISFNTNAVQLVDYNGVGSLTHWEVDDWEQGTTEPGSSGAPLFNAQKRVIGQLHGGEAACDFIQGYDAFGSFAVSWDAGNTPNTRLKDWLDPDDTEVAQIDGMDYAASNFEYDVALLEIKAPPKFLCNAPTVQPSIVVRNMGSQLLTNFEVQYTINGGQTYSYTALNGSLAFFATAEIQLPEINAMPLGVKNLEVKLLNPNNQTDQNLNNNQKNYTFENVNGRDIRVELKTDGYAVETSYNIVNSENNTVVYSSTGFLNNQLFVNDFCLPEGCYKFIIYDSYGDGICCGEGNGKYQVFDAANNLIAEGGEFAYSKSHNFCIEAVPLPAPVATINAPTQPKEFCVNAEIEFSGISSTSEANEYEWIFEGGTPAQATTPTATVQYAQAGNYAVTLIVKNDYGIDTLTLPDYIHILPYPQINLTATPENLNAQNGQVSASIANALPNQTFEYKWSNNETQPTITNLSAGIYSLTVTNNTGCEALNSTIVNILLPTTAFNNVLIYNTINTNTLSVFNANPENIPVIFTFFDIMGKKLGTYKVPEGNSLVTNDWQGASGIYFIEVQVADKKYIQKLLLNKK